MSLIHTHHVPLVPLFQVHDPMTVCPHWSGGGENFFKKKILITEVYEKYTLLNVDLSLNPDLYAWCTVRPNRLKCQSLQQRMVYCKAQAGKIGGSCSKGSNFPAGFREEDFISKIW